MYQRVQPDAKQYAHFSIFHRNNFRPRLCRPVPLQPRLHVILRTALASKALNATCHTTVHQSETGVRTQVTAHIAMRKGPLPPANYITASDRSTRCLAQRPHARARKTQTTGRAGRRHADGIWRGMGVRGGGRCVREMRWQTLSGGSCVCCQDRAAW
jgi:hypothetical protein